MKYNKKILKDNINEYSPESLLIKSSKCNFIDGIKKALTDGVNNNCCIHDSLINSIIFGYVEIFKLIIENNIDIHNNYEELLRIASEKNNIEIVKYLVEHCADIHIGEDHPLKMSISHNNIELTKYLISNGADVKSKNNYMIKWSATNGNLGMLKLAIENGADVNSVNEQNQEKRYRIYKYVKTLKYLVDNNYKLNIKEALYNVNHNINVSLGSFLVNNHYIEIDDIKDNKMKEIIKLELRNNKIKNILDERL